MRNGLLTLATLGLFLAAGLPLNAADAKKGEAAFENCSVCHNSDSTETKIGPGLKGVFKREKLVNGKPVIKSQDVTVEFIAPDSVTPGQTFTVTIPGGSALLPSSSNGLTITSYSNQ